MYKLFCCRRFKRQLNNINTTLSRCQYLFLIFFKKFFYPTALGKFIRKLNVAYGNKKAKTEMERFELSRRFHDLLPFQGSPFSHLGTSPNVFGKIYLHKKERRGWDSNPRPIAESPVFKTGSLHHSDTSAYWHATLAAHQL